VAVQAQEYEEMSKLTITGRIGAVSSLAMLLALAAAPITRAEDAGSPVAPTPAAPAEPTVRAAEPTVLPNAPKVGDTAPSMDSGTAGGHADEAAGSPNWPCVQRKVMTISAAQIWDGPPVDDVKGWENDEKIAELTTYLESRRIPLEDAEKAIKDWVDSLPAAERDKKLTELFASVLKKINADRGFVIDRVEAFQRRQKARADELEKEGRKLSEMDQEIPPDEQLGPRDATLTPEQQEYNWNARIFQDRQQNLTVACEIPILIEQRAFEIAKLIRAQMSN
jgi:hypothetical protein